MISVLLVSLALTIAAADVPKEKVKQIVFEEQRIEGKIRRPQLVMIKAEQRPELSPILMHSYGKISNVNSAINDQIIEDSPYKEPFMFNGTKISNYIP